MKQKLLTLLLGILSIYVIFWGGDQFANKDEDSPSDGVLGGSDVVVSDVVDSGS